MEPTVLMYNLSPASRTQVELLCRELGAAARNVEKQRQGLTLGALVGLLPEVPGGSQVPGEMLVMAYFDRDMLDDFLRELPPPERVLFLRRYWWADSLGEAAAHCGIPVRRAKSVLARLRKALRSRLEKEEIML